MATISSISVTDRSIIQAVNTPGGAIFQWRDQIGAGIKQYAEGISPVNDPLNAMHRGGESGTYAMGWDWHRRGSNGNTVRAVIFNTAGHAQIVEYGRSASTKMQIFSWTEYGGATVRVGGPPDISALRPLQRRASARAKARRKALEEFIAGLPPRIGSKTAAREGEHVLSRAVVAVLGAQGISARVDQ